MGTRSKRLLRATAALLVALLLGLSTRLAWLGNIDERAAERYAVRLETARKSELAPQIPAHANSSLSLHVF